MKLFHRIYPIIAVVLLVGCQDNSRVSDDDNNGYLTKDIVAQNKDALIENTSSAMLSAATPAPMLLEVRNQLKTIAVGGNSCMDADGGEVDSDVDGIPDNVSLTYSSCMQTAANGITMSYSGERKVKDLSLQSRELALQSSAHYTIEYSGQNTLNNYSYQQEIKISSSGQNTSHFVYSQESQGYKNQKYSIAIEGEIVKTGGMSMLAGGIVNLISLRGSMNIVSVEGRKYRLKFNNASAQLFLDASTQNFEGKINLVDGKSTISISSKFGQSVVVFFNGEVI